MENANEPKNPEQESFRQGSIVINRAAAALLFGIVLGSGLGGVAVYSQLQQTKNDLQSTTNAMESYRRELDRAKAQIADLNVAGTSDKDLVSNSKQCWESLTQARAQLILYMGNNSSQLAEIDSLKQQARNVQYLPAPPPPQEVTAATILYEPQTRELGGIPLAHGMLKLKFGLAAGPALSALVPQQLSGMQPRWYVPGKVIPTFVGNPGATQIFFFDLNTRQMDGPYQPQYTPASQ